MGGSAPLSSGSPAPVFLWKLFKLRLCHSEKYPLLIHVGFRYVNIAQTESIAAKALYEGWGACPPKRPLENCNQA